MATDVIEKNNEGFTDFYNIRPRLKYPDLMYVNLFMKYVKPDTSVKKGISIGCGDGAQEFLAIENGIAMTGVDITEVAIQRLQKWAHDDGLSIDSQVCDQTDLSVFPDNSFDFAISWSVISYGSIETGQKAIDEIHRVLRPGGHFIGLLESLEHTGYTQSGAEKLGERTYKMPESVEVSQPGLVLTYYNENHVHQALKNFSDLTLSHRVLNPPGRLNHKVGQWMFHCAK